MAASYWLFGCQGVFVVAVLANIVICSSAAQGQKCQNSYRRWCILTSKSISVTVHFDVFFIGDH